MRRALAFLILFSSTEAMAEGAKPPKSTLVCQKIAYSNGNLKKTCYYDCRAWEGARTENVYDHCPGWTLRWRLSQNGQFGPHPSS